MSKYYWLKLKEDFFDQHEIKWIMSQPNGKRIALFYIQLLTESITHDGALRFSDHIPYTVEMLASITSEDVSLASEAIDFLKELHLMEQLEDGTYIMTQIEELIGSETESAAKKRQQRNVSQETEGQSEDNVPKCRDNVATMSQDVQTMSQDVPKMSRQCPTENRDKRLEIRDKNIYKRENPKIHNFSERDNSKFYEQIEKQEIAKLMGG